MLAGGQTDRRPSLSCAGKRAFRCLMSLQLRLAKLSHAQLLELAVDACKSSPELKNNAAVVAQVAPLPGTAWTS